MAKTQVVNSTTTTTNIPEYARPYYEDLMTRAQAESNRGYLPYGYKYDEVTGKAVPDPEANAQRIADFTDSQNQTFSNILNNQGYGQFGTASSMAQAAGLGALNVPQVGGGDWQNYQMGPVDRVQAMQVQNPSMRAARTSYTPNLQNYQMNQPGLWNTQAAQQYMSPYIQSVLDVQKREAITDAQKSQLAANLGAARQGTYGGSRQLLAATERERALGQQLGDIQAKGLQSAYDNAQSQFERDRSAGMQVGLANQQANLGVQQLGTSAGLQTALANLTNEQQARVQNQAAALQAQGMNQSSALQAALANQSMDYNVGQQNLNANLTVQQQRNQAALQAAMANQQAYLQGSAQANQAAQTMTNIGTAQSQSDLARYGQQMQVGQAQQGLNQQYLDTAYQDFLRQRDYPKEQLSFYSGLMHGLPVTPNSTTTTYAPSPSAGAQIGGLGLGALSLYNMAKG